jgi:hypothetical protein
MAQKTASTVKSEVSTVKVSLQFGKTNNFYVWRLFQFDRCSIEFGFQANVLKNNVPFVPPTIVAADYSPLLAPVEAQLSNAALALLRVDVKKRRIKEVLRLKQTMPKFYATLWESLSIESRGEVSQRASPSQSRPQCSVDHHQRDSSHVLKRRLQRPST